MLQNAIKEPLGGIVQEGFGSEEDQFEDYCSANIKDCFKNLTSLFLGSSS